MYMIHSMKPKIMTKLYVYFLNVSKLSNIENSFFFHQHWNCAVKGRQVRIAREQLKRT